MTIQVLADNRDSRGAEHEQAQPMVRPGRAVLAGIQDRRASLGTGSLASSQAGLRPQYARAGPWYSAESRRLPKQVDR
jgi:hypothetical protein